MKKLVFLIACLLILASCGGSLSAEQIAGAWENSQGDRVYFNSDGTYEIKYKEAAVGELASENGKYELRGGKILFSRRDKYTLTENGDIKFERLIYAEDRKEKISLSDSGLEINEMLYIKQED